MGDVFIVLGPLSYHLSWVHLSSAQLFEHAQVNGKETCWMTNRWSPMLQRTGIPTPTRRFCKPAIFWTILSLSALSTWKTTTPSKFHNVGSSLHKRPSFFCLKWKEQTSGISVISVAFHNSASSPECDSFKPPLGICDLRWNPDQQSKEVNLSSLLTLVSGIFFKG